MFTMMNHMRLGVGLHSLGLAERSLQLARDYARERLQGRANARLLRAGAPALDPKVSHLYLRYHLEVAYLMDRKHRTIRQIFADPPDEATLLAQIKADPTL